MPPGAAARGWGRAPWGELGGGADLFPQGSLKSECPFGVKEEVGGRWGREGHSMVYSVDTSGSLGSGQSPRLAVSEKSSGGRGNTTPSRQGNLINKNQKDTDQSHVDAEPAVEKPREGGTGWSGPAGLACGNGTLPRPRGSCFMSRNSERNHTLTDSRRFSCTPNRGPAISAQHRPLQNPLHSFLTHPFPHSPGPQPGQSVRRRATSPQPDRVGMVSGHGGPIPLSAGTAHDPGS